MTRTVRDVMLADLVTVEPSTMMTEAAAAMSSARVGSVLVLEEGALVGIFTERDILSAFGQFRAHRPGGPPRRRARPGTLRRWGATPPRVTRGTRRPTARSHISRT